MNRAATGPEDAKPPTGEGGARRRSMMCVGKRGRLGMCLSAFPHQKPKRQTGGWAGVCHYQTQPRYPVEASMRMEIRRPRTGPTGRGSPRGPRHRPDAQPSAVTGFPNVSTTTRAAAPKSYPTAQEVPRMVGKDNQKPHIRIHRMSSSSMEKQQKLFYTEEPDCIQSHFSSQPAARRPSTSKTPYQLGIMDRAATGPEDAKPPTAQPSHKTPTVDLV